MKSILITCQEEDDTRRGDNRPGYLALSGLSCRQVEQEDT
jgi:hypothetical protein